ncbi:hypothetical protein [Pedobacter aquatilis]|uniref:hypothetical protein n=1 Tax=Pedobacter aquatilis TaxID=351343 RepID=UPI00292CE226|nr:hypothetical protein [Pedobacter aquatilis]
MKNLKIKSGLLAFVFGLAIVFSQSAFKYADKQNGKSFDTRTFYYHGPSTYSVAEVEDEANWNTTPPEELCDQQLQAACRIDIDVNYVDNPSSSTPTLKSIANLSAVYNTPTSSAYINGSADVNMTKENKTR